MSDFDIGRLLQHTRALATEYPQRYMGEPEEELAAVYIARELERAGAEVTLHRVPVLGWELEDEPRLEILAPEQATLDCAPSFYSGSTPAEGLAGQLVRQGDNFAGSGPVYKGETAPAWPKYGIVAEGATDPLAFVLARPLGPVIAQMGSPTGSTDHRNGPIYTCPACSIGQADGERIAAWLAAGQAIDVRYVAHASLKSGRVTTIVRGEIRGARFPDEAIVLGVHHDTMGAIGMPAAVNSPGACDNASAVGIMLELARMYAKDRPARTLWLCSFGGEERHLVGSSAYVRMLNEARQLGRVVAYLGVDQAAYGDVLRLLASADEPHLEPRLNLREILGRAAKDLGLVKQFNTYGPAPVHAASDHWPFFYAGIPAFLTGWHPFDGWHRHTDSFDLCTRDDEFLAAARLWQRMIDEVCALPALGAVDRSLAAGYVLTPPTV